MGLCLIVARKLRFCCLRLEKASAMPSAIRGIEPLRLCAFAPPGSPLDLRTVVYFPGRMNNPGYHRVFCPAAMAARGKQTTVATVGSAPQGCGSATGDPYNFALGGSRPTWNYPLPLLDHGFERVGDGAVARVGRMDFELASAIAID